MSVRSVCLCFCVFVYAFSSIPPNAWWWLIKCCLHLSSYLYDVCDCDFSAFLSLGTWHDCLWNAYRKAAQAKVRVFRTVLFMWIFVYVDGALRFESEGRTKQKGWYSRGEESIHWRLYTWPKRSYEVLSLFPSPRAGHLVGKCFSIERYTRNSRCIEEVYVALTAFAHIQYPYIGIGRTAEPECRSKYGVPENVFSSQDYLNNK